MGESAVLDDFKTAGVWGTSEYLFGDGFGFAVYGFDWGCRCWRLFIESAKKMLNGFVRLNNPAKGNSKNQEVEELINGSREARVHVSEDGGNGINMALAHKCKIPQIRILFESHSFKSSQHSNAYQPSI